MNSFTLIGRLGTEPVACTSGESVLVRLSIGVNEKTNKAEKKTDWFEVILWNSLAIVAGKYFQTGDKVYIRGHLESRTYEDSDGVQHNVTQIVADEAEKIATARINMEQTDQN